MTPNGLAKRSNHNKATCALANKLARIGYATLRATHADIEMELAHIDAGVEPVHRAVRYPTLLMHVHDRQLFGLRGWMKKADALTLG